MLKGFIIYVLCLCLAEQLLLGNGLIQACHLSHFVSASWGVLETSVCLATVPLVPSLLYLPFLPFLFVLFFKEMLSLEKK